MSGCIKPHLAKWNGVLSVHWKLCHRYLLRPPIQKWSLCVFALKAKHSTWLYSTELCMDTRWPLRRRQLFWNQQRREHSQCSVSGLHPVCVFWWVCVCVCVYHHVRVSKRSRSPEVFSTAVHVDPEPSVTARVCWITCLTVVTNPPCDIICGEPVTLTCQVLVSERRLSCS